MRRGTGLWGATLALALALASTGCEEPTPPLQPLDPEFVRTMRPVIQDDLAATLNIRHSLPVRYGEVPGWELRYFCDVRIIEVTPMPAQGAYSVGVLADCHVYERVGTELVKGMFGETGPWLVELDGPRVHSSINDPEGHEPEAWNKRWSKQATDEMYRLMGTKWADPAVAARRHFGLPADAPLR